MKAIIDGQVMEMSEPSWTLGPELQKWVERNKPFGLGVADYVPSDSADETADERARCLAAVHKALADWPQVPSESTKRFAAMVIANIEGKA